MEVRILQGPPKNQRVKNIRANAVPHLIGDRKYDRNQNNLIRDAIHSALDLANRFAFHQRLPIILAVPKKLGTEAARESRLSTPEDVQEELLRPSHDEARTLCELAARVQELAPWQWMEETDIFGIEDPDTGELGFISIMGQLGEHEAVAVYRGAEGLYGFLDLLAAPEASPEAVLEIPQIQMAFTESQFLEKPDRDLLKAQGLKSRGARVLQFRSYRPGYHCWFITREEARLLSHGLSQTLDVIPRLLNGPHNFQVRGDGEGFLMRVARREGTALVWMDVIRKVDRPAAAPIQTKIDTQTLENLRCMRREGLEVEADLFIGPGRIGPRGARPRTMYVLMLADSKSGFIFGLEAMAVEGSLAEMYASVSQKMALLLLESQFLPRQIIVRSHRLRQLLAPMAKLLNLQLAYAVALPAIDQAKAHMAQFLMSR